MATILLSGRDASGIPTYSLRQSGDKFSGKLVSNVEQIIDAPSESGNYEVHFSPSIGNNFWFSVNETAEFPSGAFSETSSEQNPGPRIVNAGDKIHLITEDSSMSLSVSFYKIVFPGK